MYFVFFLYILQPFALKKVEVNPNAAAFIRLAGHF